jgi:hypothetical protein
MATIMTPPCDEERPATAAVGRSRRKRFSLAGLNLGGNSKVTEKEANNSHNNSDAGCVSSIREDRTGTSSNSSSSATSLLSPKTSTNAAASNPKLSAATAVASRDPRARRGSLPIFDRISASKDEPSDSRGKAENTVGTGTGTGTGSCTVTPSSAAVASSGTGTEETPNADFERRGPPRRRHSASAKQIEAISRQAFGGGDAAAYDSDSSSDSSAWLDSESNSDDES